MENSFILHTPVPTRDTLISCFCHFLFGRRRTNRQKRAWLRNELLKLVIHDWEFILLHRNENCIYDRDRICQLFHQRFQVEICFPAEGLRIGKGRYCLYLLHENCRFSQLLPIQMQDHGRLVQVFDLRMVLKDRCPVVARFEPSAQGSLHKCHVSIEEEERLFTVHPKAGTTYANFIPLGQNLYVFAEEDCVSVMAGGDPVNPYFVLKRGSFVLSIIICESISRAQQYLETELYGSWKAVTTSELLDGPLDGLN